MTMTGKLEAFAEANDVRYFLFNFTDIRGMQRSRLAPAAARIGRPELSSSYCLAWALRRQLGEDALLRSADDGPALLAPMS